MKTVNREEASMRSEYDFSKGQRGRYVGRVEPGDTDPRNCKVTMTIQLDADLVQYFKRRSSKSNTSFEDQINEFLRDHIDPATEQLKEAHRYLAHARESQDRKIYWAAWDDTCRAISAALKAAINHECQKDNRGIYDDPNIGNQINLAESLKLLSTELCKSAELILMQVPESQAASMSPEDSKDAIAAAQDIIKAVECIMQNNSNT